MSDPKDAAGEAMSRAANRLHHLSMRYSGSLVELVAGRAVGMLGKGHPGLREARDLIDLVLLTRAEINGLLRLLVDAGVVTEEAFARRMAEEYEWLAREKAKFLGVGLTDFGITFDVGPKPGGN